MGLFCMIESMSSRPHGLTQIDPESRRAVCNTCGPVDIRVRNRGTRIEYGCMVKRRAEKKPELLRAQWLRLNFDLTVQEYDVILLSQQGVCAICAGVNEDGHRLGVDHDHVTGKIRGLLCRRCNLALGSLRDDPKIVAQALKYLRTGGTWNDDQDRTVKER